MKKASFCLLFTLFFISQLAKAQQLDLNNLNLRDILGKVITVENGFSPKFYIGNVQIPKVDKVAEILSLKHIDEVNKLFKTFKTGRTVFHLVSYTGTAVAAYGAVKAIANSDQKSTYQTAIISGASAIGTGILVKLLTKGAANKAVDIFNNAAQKKIRDIFKIGAASQNVGLGLYVKL